jgi:aminomethyltransferase
MDTLKRTVLYEEHLGLGAKMMDFGGYEMPVNYPGGILEEHLNTRKKAGLFDISHMGRFRVSGAGALAFLQHCLSSNVRALDVMKAQYAIIPGEDGGALDDAYLYRLAEEEYLLVVNASNALKDREYLNRVIAGFDARMDDLTEDMGMISLQGPESKSILLSAAATPFLTEPVKNAMNCIRLDGKDVLIAKTGYTGEPIGYELFVKAEETAALWRRLIAEGAKPAGLGARDTLRLEAGLPLYGHELGADAEGKTIPIFSSSLAKFAVSFSEAKGDYIGRTKLLAQFEAFERIMKGRFDGADALPRLIRAFAMTGKGVPRAGYRITRNGEDVGYVTSGSAIPYYITSGEGLAAALTEERATRRIGLALLRNDLQPGDEIEADIRGRKETAVIVRYHLRSTDPPFARVILHGAEKEGI